MMLEDFEQEFLKLVDNSMSRKSFMDALWDYKERPEKLEELSNELVVFAEGYAVGRKTQFDKLYTERYELTKAKEESEKLKKKLAEAKEIITEVYASLKLLCLVGGRLTNEQIALLQSKVEDFIKGVEND